MQKPFHSIVLQMTGFYMIGTSAMKELRFAQF